MENYTNVEVNKLANIYFEGKVISRNIFFKDGSKKTLGVMLVGEYEFKTISKEVLEIISGKLSFKVDGADNWQSIREGMSFNVPKNSTFNLKVIEVVNYSCSYIDE